MTGLMLSIALIALMHVSNVPWDSLWAAPFYLAAFGVGLFCGPLWGVRQ